MAVTQAVHHHRSTTKASNKPYKSRHASKSSVKDKEKGAPVVPCSFQGFVVSNSVQAKLSGVPARPLTSNS